MREKYEISFLIMKSIKLLYYPKNKLIRVKDNVVFLSSTFGVGC